MIKGVYWPTGFWTIEDFSVKIDMTKHRLNISCCLKCDGDRLIDEVNSEPKGIVFSASFDSLRKMARIICDDDKKGTVPMFLAQYIINNIVEGLANRIYDDYLPNVKESKDYEGNGKDEAFLKDYCIEKLSTDQYNTIEKMHIKLTKKLKNIL